MKWQRHQRRVEKMIEINNYDIAMLKNAEHNKNNNEMKAA
jgi:hypothetical protein